MRSISVSLTRCGQSLATASRRKSAAGIAEDPEGCAPLKPSPLTYGKPTPGGTRRRVSSFTISVLAALVATGSLVGLALADATPVQLVLLYMPKIGRASC